MSRIASGVGVLAMTAIIATVIGFVVFDRDVAILARNIPETQAQAIVVFTGGKNRVVRALFLLEQGRGERLLISGVHPATTKSILRARTGQYERLFRCCIDIDTLARDTVGNAREAATWAKKRGYSSLMLVTSAYHLPRSMLELSAVLPDVELIGYPVVTPSINYDRWWATTKGLRILASEYFKYLAARVRLALKLGQ